MSVARTRQLGEHRGGRRGRAASRFTVHHDRHAGLHVRATGACEQRMSATSDLQIKVSVGASTGAGRLRARGRLQLLLGCAARTCGYEQRLSSDDIFQETSARYRAVEPEQWLQRHPEAGSSWPSWPKASHKACSERGKYAAVEPPRSLAPVRRLATCTAPRSHSSCFRCVLIT